MYKRPRTDDAEADRPNFKLNSFENEGKENKLVEKDYSSQKNRAFFIAEDKYQNSVEKTTLDWE